MRHAGSVGARWNVAQSAIRWVSLHARGGLDVSPQRSASNNDAVNRCVHLSRMAGRTEACAWRMCIGGQRSGIFICLLAITYLGHHICPDLGSIQIMPDERSNSWAAQRFGAPKCF